MQQFRAVEVVESYKDSMGRFHSAEWRVIDTFSNRYLDCRVSDRIECDRHARFLNAEVPKEIAIEMLKAEMKSPG